jgi:hypothetical protein
VNPSTLAKYGQAFKHSRAKGDPSDAEYALEILLQHRDILKPFEPQSLQMRTLLYLVEHRRRLVGDKIRLILLCQIRWPIQKLGFIGKYSVNHATGLGCGRGFRRSHRHWIRR